MTDVKLQQYFLLESASVGLLDRLDLRNRNIIEFGAGAGALTRLLLKAGAASVESWELDPDLGAPVVDPRLTWRTRDIFTAGPADLRGRAVATFPPYSTLPFLMELCRDVTDLLWMVPDECLDVCHAMGMREISHVGGEAFTPSSWGVHHIMARGYGLAP